MRFLKLFGLWGGEEVCQKTRQNKTSCKFFIGFRLAQVEIKLKIERAQTLKDIY